MTDPPGAAPGPTISSSPGAVQVIDSSNVHVYVRSGGSEHRLPLSPAARPLNPSVMSPARILQAGSGVLSFVDRSGLLEKVWDWAVDARPFAGCVIGGNAGTGKTRLGIEISERARKAEWITGLLTDKPSDVELEALIELRAKRLVVVDYAELTGELLETLVPRLAYSATADAPVRVVLLVRTKPRGSDDFRDPLRGPRRRDLERLLDEMDVQSLNDKPLDDAERKELFERAVADLAKRAGRTTLPADTAAVVLDPFRDPLSVVIAAYLATHDPEAAVPTTRESLFDALINNHEHAYWTVSERYPTATADPRIQESVVALASLTTARTRAEAIKFLQLLPELHDSSAERRTSLADWAASLYPAEGFWGALQPDAIGEHLIARCFADQPELLGRVIDSDNPTSLVRPLQVFARLGLSDGPLRYELGRLLSERLERLCLLAAKHAKELSHIEEILGAETLAASLDQAVGTLPLRVADLPEALTALQATPSLALASLRLALATALVTALRAICSEDPTERRIDRLARALNAQATAMSPLGRTDDALEAINEAVTSYRALAADRPDAYALDLASALNNQSTVLSQLGHHDAALEAATDAVASYQLLVAVHPGAYLQDLATALNNQSNALGRVGRYAAALEAINEAVASYRALAADNRDDHLPNLAMVLLNQSNALDRLGQLKAALESINEAVTSYRGLAAAHPDAYSPDLATALNNQSTVLDRLGRHDAALDSVDEAIASYRALAAAHPDAYLHDLAAALNNQSNVLVRLGRFDEARAAIDESVLNYQGLHRTHSDAHLPNLANALNNQSAVLHHLDHQNAALVSVDEAIASYRALAAAHPDAYNPPLAAALNNKGNVLDDLGRHRDALTAINEAVTIRRALAAAHPDAYLANLAMALHNLANTLANATDVATAADRSEEAARIGLAALRRSRFALPDGGRRLLANYERLSKRAGLTPDGELVDGLRAAIGKAEP